jgi:CHASE2 domain-containing sensor protein
MPAGAKPAKSYIIRGVIYVVVGVFFTFSEFAWHLWSERPCEPGDAATESALVTRRFYTYLTTLDWRKPQNRFTTVITIRENREPQELFDNFCAHREFLALMIKEIVSQDPAGIVVDNYFSNEPCPVDRQLTQILSNSKVPVIVGLHTLNKQELEHWLKRRLTPKELESFGRACLVVHNNLKLNLPEETRVHYGLLRFNADTRKLPLSWPVFSSPEQIAPQDSPEFLKTLAAEAAITIPGTSVPDLETHPYTSFLKEDEIHPLPAMEVLCQDSSSSVNWKNCASPGTKFEDRLRHRVVLIGDDTDDDQHDTPMGAMAGVLLHANYIEALGGPRYFRPIGQQWQIAGGILLLVLIEFIYVKTRKPLLGLAFSFGSVVVLWFLCALVAALTGILPVIWAPGAVALFLRFGEAIRERTLEGEIK